MRRFWRCFYGEYDAHLIVIPSCNAAFVEQSICVVVWKRVHGAIIGPMIDTRRWLEACRVWSFMQVADAGDGEGVQSRVRCRGLDLSIETDQWVSRAFALGGDGKLHLPPEHRVAVA
jgi:hypothetical protein